MEHTFKIEKELKITTENIVDCVLSCEAGGFDYWGELCSDEKDYEAARRRLTEREKADMKPCYSAPCWTSIRNCWWPLSNPCNARNAITDAGTTRIIPAG